VAAWNPALAGRGSAARAAYHLCLGPVTGLAGFKVCIPLENRALTAWMCKDRLWSGLQHWRPHTCCLHHLGRTDTCPAEILCSSVSCAEPHGARGSAVGLSGKTVAGHAAVATVSLGPKPYTLLRQVLAGVPVRAVQRGAGGARWAAVLCCGVVRPKS
jgi:hypothetical protein